MFHRLGLAAATAALAAFALTGCSAPAADPPVPEATVSSEPTPTPTPTPEAAPPTLLVGDSALGPIVVDAAGLSLYSYDADTPGSGVSACSGECLVAWPPVHGSADATVDGITAAVGSITGNDGQPQLTLDGMPLYTYITDLAPGDITGQGSHGVWWVIAPDGSKLTG